MEKLAGLKLDLLEASKAVETFDVEDVRNMFEQAGYVVEFDNSSRCYYPYKDNNVADLIYTATTLVEDLQSGDYY